MPARINKAPTLTPSRRSPRVPPSSKTTNEIVQAPKPLNLTTTSPQDNSLNFRFYNPNPPASSPRLSGGSPETPSSRRRTFQSRPSRLSTVHTPTVDPPAATSSSRRTRRTAALETPKKEISDIDFPESTGSTGWTFDHYMGSFESEGTVDALSSPTSTPDMRNSSRIRKPTMRAIESLESSKKQTRRKNTTTLSPPTVETPDPLASKVATDKVSKKSPRKTRKSKRVSNLTLRKNAVLIGFDIDVKFASTKLYDLTIEALSPSFTIPINFPASWEQQRSEYFRRQDEEKYGVDPITIKKASSNDVDGDVDMIGQDLSTPAISPSPPTPPPQVPEGPSILCYEKQSEPRAISDGWILTGHVNLNNEEVSLAPEQYHPYYSAHTYGYEGLPFPPVCARSGQQADADSTHGFPPFMGDRNLPSDANSPFVTENVAEEKARVVTRTPVPVFETKKPRVRKRRQTAAAGASDEAVPVTSIPGTTTTDPPAPAAPAAPGAAAAEKEKGGRKSQRRRRQTAPASTLSPTSPPSPPTTATAVQSSGRAAAVTPAPAKGKKPKVQRLRLTLKPASKIETSGDQTSTEAPAVQSPSSPALSRAPSSAPTNKRRRRGA